MLLHRLTGVNNTLPAGRLCYLMMLCTFRRHCRWKISWMAGSLLPAMCYSTLCSALRLWAEQFPTRPWCSPSASCQWCACRSSWGGWLPQSPQESMQTKDSPRCQNGRSRCGFWLVVRSTSQWLMSVWQSGSHLNKSPLGSWGQEWWWML